jgi:transposase
MLSLPEPVQIYVAVQPADMRRSFDGLAAHVRDWLGQDPLSGHLFVFRNKRGDRVKILFWDRDGMALYYKRLEEGVVRFPASGDPHAACVQVSAEELALLLWGIDPSSVRRRKRYARPAAKSS